MDEREATKVETAPDGCCHALLFHGPDDPLELCQVELPSQLQPGEALVQVTCCTLCGSDLSTMAGHRHEPTPSILGHEIVGRIEALGNEALIDLRGRTVRVGDRVVWSVIVACQECRFCRRGLPQKCVALRKYGHHRQDETWRLSGGLAEKCHLLRGTQMVVVDPSLSDTVLAPASCATATAAAAIRTAGNLAAARVLIFGAGMLGLTAAAMAATQGAEAVTLCDPSSSRLSWGARFGAQRSILWDQLVHRPSPELDLFDCILEMSGSAAAVQAALDCAEKGASIVLVGSVRPTPPVELYPEQLIRRSLSLHGVHNYRPEDLLAAVQFLEQSADRFPFAEVVSAGTNLRQLNSELTRPQTSLRMAVHP